MQDNLFKYQFFMEPIVKEHLADIGRHNDTQTSITLKHLIETEWNRIYNIDAGANTNGAKQKL